MLDYKRNQSKMFSLAEWKTKQDKTIYRSQYGEHFLLIFLSPTSLSTVSTICIKKYILYFNEQLKCAHICFQIIY